MRVTDLVSVGEFYTVPRARVIFTAKTSLDVFSLRREQVWPICSSGTQIPLYSAASLGYHVIGPRAKPPRHFILTQGRAVMLRGRYFILVPCKQGPLPF